MKPETLQLQQLLNKHDWTVEEEQWFRAYLENNDPSELQLLLKQAFENDLAAGKRISPAISMEMRRQIFSKAGIQLHAETDQIPAVPAYQAIEEQDSYSSNIPSQSRPKLYRLFAWRAAAAVLFVCTSALTIYYIAGKKSGNIKSLPANNTLAVQPVIVPGSNKATLKLANGAVVVLDSASNGYAINQAGGQLTNQDGKLFYHAAADKNQLANAATAANPVEVVYNVLTTPKGGQYQVVLQDGTRVWLNAASSLKYPTSFPGNDRTVELTGEAYFEVAKNKDKPFHVLAPNHLQVEVLGTHFDVMAYEEEGMINTALAEGSVQLSRDGQSVHLLPGQQGILQQNSNSFHVSNTDLEQVLAWKSGMFQFGNLNIQTIMRQVARWYDVDVSYEGNLQNQVYSGAVARKENIQELLKFLEYTGTVHFTIEGRKIIVTK